MTRLIIICLIMHLSTAYSLIKMSYLHLNNFSIFSGPPPPKKKITFKWHLNDYSLKKKNLITIFQWSSISKKTLWQWQYWIYQGEAFHLIIRFMSFQTIGCAVVLLSGQTSAWLLESSHSQCHGKKVLYKIYMSCLNLFA